jgi:2-polyprenyl-3-methyl-5-hydroxy-6-metoxy-1,4-benzoquinol methylase
VSDAYCEYGFTSAEPAFIDRYLTPQVLALAGALTAGTRVLDVGCGNGWLAGRFRDLGCNVVGVDLSEQGIAIARRAFPEVRFELLAADDRLLARLGEAPFDLVISTEVIEHLYDPRSFVRGCCHALRPGGRFVLSTPYHGYAKNLALALAGKWDAHANPLWDGGHIKFWSRATLGQLLLESGFTDVRFRGAGRAPFFYKSMVMSANRAS